MQRALRECKEVGCHNLTREENGYCEEHQDVAMKKILERRKRLFNKNPNCATSIYNTFYRSYKWISKRSRIMQQYDYLCVNCKGTEREGTPSETVHHIEEIRLAWDKRLDNDNLIPLCEECHKEIHKRYRKGKQYKQDEQNRLRILLQENK